MKYFKFGLNQKKIDKFNTILLTILRLEFFGQSKNFFSSQRVGVHVAKS
jgi:hypothetical protein